MQLTYMADTMPLSFEAYNKLLYSERNWGTGRKMKESVRPRIRLIEKNKKKTSSNGGTEIKLDGVH